MGKNRECWSTALLLHWKARRGGGRGDRAKLSVSKETVQKRLILAGEGEKMGKRQLAALASDNC